jgi:hypothetical protein
MTKADQFREYAEEAMQWSRQSRTEDARKVLIDLALTWRQAAFLSERNLSVRQNKESKRRQNLSGRAESCGHGLSS